MTDLEYRRFLWRRAAAILQFAAEMKQIKDAQVSACTRKETAAICALLGAYQENARRLAHLLVTAAQHDDPRSFQDAIALAEHDHAEMHARIGEMRREQRCTSEGARREEADRPA